MKLQHNFDTFITKFMKIDPEFWYVAFAFLVACMFWAYPIFFSRDDVLGKLIMVAGIIAMTLYHRIAGILALVVVIALLNRTPAKNSNSVVEGLTLDSSVVANPLLGTTPSPPPATIKTPDDFRRMHCMTGIKDAAKVGDMPDYGYMLKPDLFTDASGNPTMNMEGIKAVMLIDMDSLKKCKPVSTVPNTPGYNFYGTISNICDPKCDWSIKPASPAATTIAPTTTTSPTTTATTTATTMPDSEGFSTMAMLRPHIRNGRRLISNGADNMKAAANRLKRKLF